MLPIAAGTKKGEMRPAPRSAKTAACSNKVVAPPSPEPMIVATPSDDSPASNRGGNPAEASASAAAAMAKCVKRSRRLICFGSSTSEGSKSIACPPKSTSWPVRSRPCNARTPERPARRPSQSAATPRPSGETAPMPVTTTRCSLLIAPASRSAALQRDRYRPSARAH